jgi:hypothetical protein
MKRNRREQEVVAGCPDPRTVTAGSPAFAIPTFTTTCASTTIIHVVPDETLNILTLPMFTSELWSLVFCYVAQDPPCACPRPSAQRHAGLPSVAGACAYFP